LPPELPSLDQVRHVHLIGVAGMGMGSLACMLADQGFRVTGSDVDAYPPMSEQLRAAGIEVQKGFAAEHALRERPDLVVIGNAIRRENPEAQAVLGAGIPYASLSDAVHHFFIRGKHAVVVAGTHGKTTTTCLVAWILTHAGLDPSVLVGGVAENLGGSFRLGEGEHFVIEGDEYDTAFFDKTPKFLHYDARSLLFTSCEFDHADIYDSLEQIQDAFRQLMRAVPEEGRIVAATDELSVQAVLREARAPVEGYGFLEDALWRTSDVAFDRDATRLTIWRGDQRLARVYVPLFGRHNVENVLGAFALCHGLGVPAEAIAAALEEFRGVRRRQELRGEAAGMLVFDDFAHHPTAVRETLAAFRARYPEHQLWAVFEPRTNTSRRRFFESAYAEALGEADRVVLAGVYRAEQIPEAERLRPESVVEAVRERGPEAWAIAEVDEIIEHVVRNRSGRDVAVIMSNGAFGGIWERLLARLRTTSESQGTE
jgi:UDP-N-acetylmuramate: L-alanyl-gamma-D-glutamyl-meso-diaminopimelate ligase